jgi:hypothetical protein
MTSPSLFPDLRVYFGRIRQFQTVDWAVYAAWVGLMLGLTVASGGFVLVGKGAGAPLPVEAWLVPLGAALFTAAIAVDTIGHRTVYKQVLRGGEALVHQVIIATGIGSCLLLIAAYPQRPALAIPAAVLTVLSFVYSLVDEALHWRRYLGGRSDVVEMWSHVGILVGHATMMAGWWRWYATGYRGVAETLAALGLA